MDEVDFWLKRSTRLNEISRLCNLPSVQRATGLRRSRLMRLYRAYDDYCWKNCPISVGRYSDS